MRGPSLPLFVLVTVAAGPAAAEVVVSSCAHVAVDGVAIITDTAFAVTLHRDPALATGARIDFTAFDPDNNGEVDIRIEPSGYTLPALRGLTWGSFNNRKSSYTAVIPAAELGPGFNQVVFIDRAPSDPFSVHRLCVSLLGAPPAAPPPASETFCARDVIAPSAIDAQNAANGTPATITPTSPATIYVEIDVPLSGEARVGLDVVAFLNNNSSSGNRNASFSSAGNVLGGGFFAPSVSDHYVVRTVPTQSALFGEGGTALVPAQVAVVAAGDFSGRYWSACFLVEDDLFPPLPDAGPLEDDGGPPDAGELDEGGGAVSDAGPYDAGVDGGGPSDASLVDSGGPNDGGGVDGGLQPLADAGPALGPDGGAGDDEDPVRGQLIDPTFQVSSSCSAAPLAPGALLGGLLGLFALARRRRASRR
jgi:hypothetical protein